MGKGGGTIGYHYLCSMLFGIGRGPVNKLLEIKVADKTAWIGENDGSTFGTINEPELFGGQDKEGGIQGVFRYFMGHRDQVLPGSSGTIVVGTKGPVKKGKLPGLKAALGGDVSEFRGRNVFFYDGLVSSMNPYIKEWKFRRYRTTAGWHNDDPWYPAKATINLTGPEEKPIFAMNPAHIVYQASTDPTLGRGIDRDELDEDSFILAANQFCNEGFGLCFHWQRDDEVGNFIQSVCDHAGMVTYTDRETGLINVKLIRNDYDPDEIPHFTTDNGLLSISEDDSGSSDEIADEVIVNGKDPINDQQIQGRAHNLAVRHFRGGATTKTLDYPGLPTLSLCNRVAERDRNLGAAGLRKFTVKLDRNGFRIHPGAVFKISYPPRGLVGLVLRAGEIDDGNMVNGIISVSCAMDVFSLPEESFVTPVDNTWTPPSQTPAAATAEIIEASYRDLYLRISAGDLATVDASFADFAVLAARPSVAATSYDLLSRTEGEASWPLPAASFFTATAVLQSNITETDTSFIVSGEVEFPPDDEALNSRGLYLDGEYMRIADYDPDTHTLTVARGTVDTWPRGHVIGKRLWLVDDDIGFDERSYLNGETVEAKVLTRTSSGVLAENAAPLLSVDLVGRAFRPYPPADVKVGGTSILTGMDDSAEPVVTWVPRNRVTQADVLVAFTEAGVTAEADTMYRIKLYDDNGDHVATYNDVISPWTYGSAAQVADGFVPGDNIKGRIYAVRDGVESLEQRMFVIRKVGGYGLGYGLNYGGS